MFPLNSNDQYIDSNGKRSKLGDAIGSGGSSELPEYSSEDAGKVLKVADDGSLEWDEDGGAGVEIISKSDWDNMTTQEKQSKGLIIIQTSDTGFIRGEYVNGADYSWLLPQQIFGDNLSNVSYEILTNTDSVYSIRITNTGESRMGIGVILNIGPDLTDFDCTFTSEDYSQGQFGLCTKEATLPAITATGTGRVSYTNTSGTQTTRNERNITPSNRNIFASASGGNFTLTVTRV